MTNTYIVQYLDGGEPDTVEADYIGEDKTVRIDFWQERPAGERNRIVLSALSSQVLTFGLKEESAEDSIPPKPSAMYPQKLSLFEVEYASPNLPDERFWAEDCVHHGDHYDFHVTSVVGCKFAIRSIYADMVVRNITAIRLPESA